AAGLASHRTRWVVEARTRKPHRTRHAAPPEDPRVRCGGVDSEVVPEGLPEAFQVLDGPAPQRRVIGKTQATLAGEPVGEFRQVGTADPLRPRGPQDFTGLHASIVRPLRLDPSPRDRSRRRLDDTCASVSADPAAAGTGSGAGEPPLARTPIPQPSRPRAR